MLERLVERVLDRNGFEYCSYRGCFDIAASKKRLMFLKVLGNIDSFQEDQARNLKIISREMNASAIVIGEATRREFLYDNIVYQRFDVPAMNVKTFESVMENEMPAMYSNRGGLFVEINPIALRKSRIKAGLTQKELASEAGVTKKNIYEHEKSQMKMSYETALRIEKSIGNGIIEKAVIKMKGTIERNMPENSFEASVSRDLERIGFSTEIVRRSPVNIVAESGCFSVLSEANESAAMIEKNALSLKKFSEISNTPLIAISKGEINAEIPSIDEKSLRNMDARDIKKFVKRW